MRFVLLASLIEGILLPLTGSILTFMMSDYGYKQSDMMLFHAFIYNIPYLFLSLIPLSLNSTYTILISGIIGSITLVILGLGYLFFFPALALVAVGCTIRIISVRLLKQKEKTVYTKYISAQRIGIALGSASIYLIGYYAYGTIYRIYSVLLLIITGVAYFFREKNVICKTTKVTNLKIGIGLAIFCSLLKAPDDIYRNNLNFFLRSKYNYEFIAIYRMFITLSFSLIGAYIANILIKKFHYINVMRIALITQSILYILHCIPMIVLYVSVFEISCKSIIRTSFLMYQSDISTDQKNYTPITLLMENIGSLIILTVGSYVLHYGFMNGWTYVFLISIMLLCASFQIRKTGIDKSLKIGH